MPLEDGTACAEGECRQGTCTSVCPCTEQGIRDAIAEGGGIFDPGDDGGIANFGTLTLTNSSVSPSSRASQHS
jgi:hypothetical protein